jgi:hypothetical protein
MVKCYGEGMCGVLGGCWDSLDSEPSRKAMLPSGEQLDSHVMDRCPT